MTYEIIGCTNMVCWIIRITVFIALAVVVYAKIKINDQFISNCSITLIAMMTILEVANEVLVGFLANPMELLLYSDAQLPGILHCPPAVICGTIVNICSRYLIVPV